MDFSEKWGSNVDEAVQLALQELGLTIDKVDVTVLEEPSRGFLGIGSKLALVRVEKKKEEPIKVIEKKEKKKVTEEKKEEPSITEPEIEFTQISDHPSITFLKDMISNMGLDLNVSAKKSSDTIYLTLDGKDSATIIGKRGQTLDAIQYLTSLVANKDDEKYIRVVVDCENYRMKREKTLKDLANRLALKVQKQKKAVKLEPMNPYERKVIHATLQNHPYVKTRSEGEEPYRRVIIELK